MTAEGIVGAIFSVLHARLLERDSRPLVGLRNELMALIVLPYLGPTAARRELARPLPKARHVLSQPARHPMEELELRITYRTLCVLTAIAAQPGASNRQVADAAGIQDPAQISKLLTRLTKLGLTHNKGQGHTKGQSNAWTLTTKGNEIQRAIDAQASHAGR